MAGHQLRGQVSGRCLDEVLAVRRWTRGEQGAGTPGVWGGALGIWGQVGK